MSSAEIKAIREEHSREGVGPEIYEFLQQVVRITAIRYPPQIYAGAPRWDEGSLAELLHDWLLERLMRGDLSLMISSSPTTAALRNQLSTSLKQLIINRRRRDSAGNLYRRTLAMLKSSERFSQVGPDSPGQALWSLAADPASEPTQRPLRGLVRIAHELSDQDLQVVRYGPHSLKSSPILREPALERFLVHLLGKAGGGLTAAQLAQVMQHRFSLLREDVVGIERELASEELVETRVETDQIAAAVVEQLDPVDLERVKALVASDWDVEATAETSEHSKSTLEVAAAGLVSLVTEFAESQEQSVAVIEKVSESLFIASQQ